MTLHPGDLAFHNQLDRHVLWMGPDCLAVRFTDRIQTHHWKLGGEQEGLEWKMNNLTLITFSGRRKQFVNVKTINKGGEKEEDCRRITDRRVRLATFEMKTIVGVQSWWVVRVGLLKEFLKSHNSLRRIYRLQHQSNGHLIWGLHSCFFSPKMLCK